MPRALLSDALGEKALPVVGHAEREVVGSEPNGHQEVASPGMAERIAHRLLDHTKGAKLDVGGKASLGAGDLELGDGAPMTDAVPTVEERRSDGSGSVDSLPRNTCVAVLPISRPEFGARHGAVARGGLLGWLMRSLVQAAGWDGYSNAAPN